MKRIGTVGLCCLGLLLSGQDEGCNTDADEDGWTVSDGDCNDQDEAIHPGASEVCDDVDNDCDGKIDDVDADADGYSPIACGGEDCNDNDPATVECTLGYGGHRIDYNGDYYYALYNDQGFGVIGTSEWYGSNDSAASPEGVTWNEDQTRFYYNDLVGYVYSQEEPFGATSTVLGYFGVGQVGGGVVFDNTYYVGDYSGANIYAMDLATGETSLYSSLGSEACKPYFGNSAMAIDVDGRVFAASSCGIVVYEAGGSATQLNSYTGLISAVAMDADQELYSLDSSGNIIHFDKDTGDTLSTVTIAYSPSTTWTLAIDEDHNILVNYWGEQRLYSLDDGSLVEEFSASTYYPGNSGYYWYVTF